VTAEGADRERYTSPDRCAVSVGRRRPCSRRPTSSRSPQPMQTSYRPDSSCRATADPQKYDRKYCRARMFSATATWSTVWDAAVCACRYTALFRAVACRVLIVLLIVPGKWPNRRY